VHDVSETLKVFYPFPYYGEENTNDLGRILGKTRNKVSLFLAVVFLSKFL